MINILNYLSSKNTIQLFFIFVGFIWAFKIASSLVTSYFAPNQLDHPAYNYGILKLFFVTVVLAPLFETFAFQYGVFKLIRVLKQSSKLFIVVSALLFGLFHTYSWIYIALSIISGFLYASAFYLVVEKNSISKAYIFVASLHALSNLLAFILTIVGRDN